MSMPVSALSMANVKIASVNKGESNALSMCVQPSPEVELVGPVGFEPAAVP